MGRRGRANGQARTGASVMDEASTAMLTVGPFRLTDDAFLRQKANRRNPRARFYAAMLAADTFEQYFFLAGDNAVQPETYKRPITPQTEIGYAIERGWIVPGVPPPRNQRR